MFSKIVVCDPDPGLREQVEQALAVYDAGGLGAIIINDKKEDEMASSK